MPSPEPPPAQPRILKGVSHLLLDIEGTTCPVSFVAEELFPYARRELPGFLREHGHEPQIRELLLETTRHWQADPDLSAQSLWQQAIEASKERRALNSEPDGKRVERTILGSESQPHPRQADRQRTGPQESESKAGKPKGDEHPDTALKHRAAQPADSLARGQMTGGQMAGGQMAGGLTTGGGLDVQFLDETGLGLDFLLRYLELLIRADRKVTPLKELQGLVWEQGYAKGHLTAPLYKDVTAALKRWHGAGVVLAVYSSGSVKAQRLLYGHGGGEDLQPLFSHWFDTRWGGKKEPASYRGIAAAMACPAETVLFISDATAELEAAEASGMRVLFSDRDGNPERDPGRFESISRYTTLELHP